MCGKASAPDYSPVAAAQLEAARIAKEASDANIAAWQAQNAQVRKDFELYRAVGEEAITALREGVKSGRFSADDWLPENLGDVPEFKFDAGTLDKFRDPGYDFRVREGLKAIRRGAGARDGADTGAAYKALINWNQDYASTEATRAYERAVSTHNLERQAYFDRRGVAIGDWELQQAAKDQDFNRLASLAGTGLNAAGATTNAGNLSVQQIASQRNLGASALGNAQIGAAQAGVNQQIANNQARQQNWNNALAVGGLGVGLATGLGPDTVNVLG